MGGWERFNTFAIWMLKIAYVNILWIGFTILGLGVFGLFPSTGAMFTIAQKWLRKEPVEKILHTFWNTYKKEFISLNKFGLFFIVIGYMFVYDFMFVQKNIDQIQFLYPVLLFLAIAYIVTLLYFFPVYTQFEMKFFQYIKQSFLIAASSLLETILILTACMLVGVLINLIPGIIPFFTGSVLAIVITWCSNRALVKMKSKKKIVTN
ncbi:YesL family protein [Bacillus sp. JJ1562]|uniref:YesL family protein n=1 Tax=Bacillus sp. JJ1562 TaxID=3122960 RepID=UPI0030020BF4